MLARRVRLVLGITIGVLAGIYLLLSFCFYLIQADIVYQPTHRPTSPELTRWQVNGQLYGYRRGPTAPRAVWLIMQGNAGQAGLRGYFKNVPPDEAIYVLEYPGYGQRSGELTSASINAAATAAYQELRRQFAGLPVGVVGESFGSGPATLLARQTHPPESIVLMVPLARFDLVMSRYMPLVPVRLLLRHNWDNVASLHDYRGPVTIYAAENDRVIPREHTLMLAASVPQSRLVWLPGGHNDAGEDAVVKLVR